MQEQVLSAQVLGEAQELANNLDDNTLSDLCSDVRKKRGKAVNRILQKLDPVNKPSDNEVLQSLPLAMISNGDHIGTMYFVEYCIENGAFFSSEIVQRIIDSVSFEKMRCARDGDREALMVMSSTLKRFYNAILANPLYQNIPEIYLSIGNEQELEQDIYGAIKLYDKALELGSVEAYMYAGSAHESKGNYEMSVSIFRLAYELTGEERFLGRYIRALSKIGKREEAYSLYCQLEKKYKDSTNPFIVYTESIITDSELQDFARLMTSYQMEGQMQPVEILAKLAQEASTYIANEIEKESTTIDTYNQIGIENWTNEDGVIYTMAIQRRLMLMQTHIITLQDPRYIDFYIQEIRQYTVDGSETVRNMMKGYFLEFSSPYVLASYQQMTENQGTHLEDMDIYESVRIHVVQIAAIFSQFSGYELIRDTLNPLVDECMKQEGDVVEDIDVDDIGLRMNRKELHEYESLSDSVRTRYVDFIEYIDQKYGMFYRRMLAQMVRDETMVPLFLKNTYEVEFKKNGNNHIQARRVVISNMILEINNPYITLFFIIEHIIAGIDEFLDEESPELFIKKYHLEDLSVEDTLLLSSLLYAHGEYELAIEFMMNAQGILDEPEVLYMLLENRYHMDEEDDPNDFIKTLDTIAQQEYDDKSFFAHVEFIARDIINSDNPSDKDIGFMLLAMANIRRIEERDYEEMVGELEQAGEYGIYQGFATLADIYEEEGEYDKAINFFCKAYLLNSSIVSLRRLLNVLLAAGRFDEVLEYIDVGLRQEYDIAGYISAWFLYQGKNHEALTGLLGIIGSQETIDMILPEGYMTLMAETIQSIISTSDTSVKIASEKIMASYVHASLSSNEETSDPMDYIKHLGYIGEVLDDYSSLDASSIFLDTLPLLSGLIEFDEETSDTDRILGYLHLHLNNIKNVLHRYHAENIAKKDIEATNKTFNLINKLTTIAVVLLERFPDSEIYLTQWRNAYNLLWSAPEKDKFIHPMPETIQ